MANVKGVILNGTKYELQDSEARELAGNAINAVETLENTVNTLESEVTAVTSDLATVAKTATTASAEAQEANGLATEAQYTADLAYDLAEKAGNNCNYIRLQNKLGSYKFYKFTEEEQISLFGKLMSQIQENEKYLIEIYSSKGTVDQGVSVETISKIEDELDADALIEGGATLILKDRVIQLMNLTESEVSIIVKATKQH